MKFEQRTESRTPVHGSERYDDREIIAREPATMAHPGTGEQVHVAGATKVLIAPRPGGNGAQHGDGDVAYECVECGYVNDSVNGVLSHTQSHTGKRRKPYYELDTIKLVVRLMRIEARVGHRGKAQRVADTLNQQGVARRNGEPWTGAHVSTLYNRWNDKVRVRIPKNVSNSTSGDTVRPAPDDDHYADDLLFTPTTRDFSPSTSAVDVANNLVDSFKQVTSVVNGLADTLRGATPAVDRLARAVAQHEHVDADTVDKARRWDEMQKLFGK